MATQIRLGIQVVAVRVMALGMCVWPCVSASVAVGQQSAAAERRASAQALFDQGRALMREGRYDEACPRLEESQRLDPGLGTQFNLAVCYEHIGRNASAWSLFLEVAALARQREQVERERVAREHASKLEPTLSRLRIEVPEGARAEGLEVRRGDVPVGEAQWGVALPSDPGPVVVMARAKAKKSFQAEVIVGGDGGTYTLEVPVLEDAPLEAKVEPGLFEGLSTPRAVGLVVGAGGILALAAGATFGLLAMGQDAASDDNCDGNLCNEIGYEDRDQARTYGDVATGLFIAGGALVGGGAALWLVGDGPEAPTRPGVALLPGPGGLSARVRF